MIHTGCTTAESADDAYENWIMPGDHTLKGRKDLVGIVL
jgi:hypothetical protein